ncbi:phosphotransferase [Streptosporangium sp. NPDC001681]|uniref:phosphotransferase n=1 Tax=Streptosporangium sp. NPDC001681 TaxID=3154395 RepID=UPI0033179E68
MRDRPEDVDEGELSRVLGKWGIGAASLAYAPVGFGDHHWIAAGDRGRKWFVTVADLELKNGQGSQAALRGLRKAMDTAATLRDQEKLDFVVAPLRAADGETVHLLGPRYALSVFPFVEGVAGDFDQPLTPQERGAVLDLLAELHQQTPPASTPVLHAELSMRGLLEKALEGVISWAGGPFAEPARTLVSGRAPGLRQRLEEFDRLVKELKESHRAPVVTHGEPHPGNLLRLEDRYLMVDWDTVGLASPERDLWSVVREPEDLARYAKASGRMPDASALTLYRLRWDLEEVSIYVDWFRAPHDRSLDMEQAWDGLVGAVERLTDKAPA